MYCKGKDYNYYHIYFKEKKVEENAGIFAPLHPAGFGFKPNHFCALAVTMHLKIPHSHLNELFLVVCGHRERLHQFSVMNDRYAFIFEQSRKKRSCGKEKFGHGPSECVRNA